MYKPVYHLAEKHHVPVVFHTGDTYAENAILKYAHPLTIDEVAVQHRNVTFVMAHLGDLGVCRQRKLFIRTGMFTLIYQG
ncbi:amidohydrolase [Bacillus sp. JCM 19045]|nr:amidohydrolase [Bacillus sp. JCM 19045]